MADTFGFSLNDAKRIGRAVRLVERDEPRQDLGGTKDGTLSRGVRLLLAKHVGTTGWPKDTTATVTVFSGDPIASAITMVAHNQFVTFSTTTPYTQRWVALGNNGFGWYAISQEEVPEPTRIGKVAADWAIGTCATVTLWESGTNCTPTVNSPTETIENVRNLSMNVASGSWVAISRAANGYWYLVEAGSSGGSCTQTIGGEDITQWPGWDGSKVQLLGHDANGCLAWFDTDDCEGSGGGGGGSGGGTNNNDDPAGPNTPSAPQGFNIIDFAFNSGVAEYALEWSAPTSDGGAAVTSYAVQYNVAGVGGPGVTVPLPSDLDPDWTAATVADCPLYGHKRVSISGLSLLDLVWFRVSAVNANGRGQYAYKSLYIAGAGGEVPCTT